MAESARPHPLERKSIEDEARAESNLCWSCGSCATECPVNIGTNRLHPRKIVWMANLGLLDEMVRLPEIWYCLACNRCSFVCPMSVKPAALVGFLRQEAVRRGLVSYETVRQYKALFTRFQRVRWHAVQYCGDSGIGSALESSWRRWMETPIPPPSAEISGYDLFSGSKGFVKAVKSAGASSCFTCRECAGDCPVYCERGVFDPVWIFRMANLGLTEELLRSPSIWLCIGCQRCTAACSQLVKGHLVIQGLKDLALSEGIVDRSFPLRWQKVHNYLYGRFLKEVDGLFGFL